ncbi:MAG: SagB/ThcOx family dehydrogenase [Bacteroidales bacterium]|nr:SagB/ThcOx family dehydrogenase [Bacteroidales bacterium]
MKITKIALLFVGIFGCSLIMAQDIKLPAPKKDGGENILKTLDIRKSDRSFKDGDISMQELSTILWAGFGYNQKGTRTAPTAMNTQDIDLYVFLENGIYKYDAKENTLNLIKKGDYRASTDRENGFAAKVTNIAIVSDLSKYERVKNHHTMNVFGAMSAAYVSQNMYLAVDGMNNDLGTVTRYGAHQEKQVKEILGLKDLEVVFLFQTIGYKK